jgi:dTDP-4-amino-4,6-dideoxygalactose transaminase
MMNVAAERRVPLLELSSQHREIRDYVLPEVLRVIDSQRFILGEEVERFEREIAAYCRTAYAVGCASGSDALTLALLALDISPGDEVLTTPYTFFATGGEIARAGAVPVFVDADEQTFNMNAELLGQTVRRHPKARAVIPVHLFGGCADMNAICSAAAEAGLAVIEDAAQAIGADYQDRRAGGIGRAGCFSFYPSKNLGCYGDGGLVTTNDRALADRLASLRVHGRTGRYFHRWIGINSRLDALQAAVLRVKLGYLDRWTEARRRNAKMYRELLSGTPVCTPVEAPYQTRHVYNQFVIRCPQRDKLQAYLTDNGIGTEVYYPTPLHLQPCFEYLGYRKGDFPVSEQLAAEALALPVHESLAEADLAYVSERIRRFYQ